MQEVVELCTKSRADRPEPLQESPTLTSRMERPDKVQAVKEHRSHFKAKDDASNSVTLALHEILHKS